MWTPVVSLGCTGQQVQQQDHQHQQHQQRPQCTVRIIEQPAPRGLRFRYECEKGRSAGSIPGASSTPEDKTYPEIEVLGYEGNALVVVSCVTMDKPHRVHPHKLVGKNGCKNGVCSKTFSTKTMMRVQFPNLGIKRIRKKDVEDSLRQRRTIRVDPFGNGFAHGSQLASKDFKALRLCFQVFLDINKDGKFTEPLMPVVSDIIYDRTNVSNLNIIRLSDCKSYVGGDRKPIMIVCEEVAKHDIEVHFYEEDPQGNRGWFAKAVFDQSEVYYQHVICFKPPEYRSANLSEIVKVFIQLYKPSDRFYGPPYPFELHPSKSASDETKNQRKRAKLNQMENIAAEFTPTVVRDLINQVTNANYEPISPIPPQPYNLSSQPSAESQNYQFRQPHNNLGSLNMTKQTTSQKSFAFYDKDTSSSKGVMNQVTNPNYGLSTTPSQSFNHLSATYQQLDNLCKYIKSTFDSNLNISEASSQPSCSFSPLIPAEQCTQYLSLDDDHQISSEELKKRVGKITGPLLDINNLSLSEEL